MKKLLIAGDYHNAESTGCIGAINREKEPLLKADK
ncbi:predicted protein [Plenodomus lingam JN3]|uniref:Predicted protein n=1 Tax=Leptosphaeria maculans (strain JN3 / isolate v23.1.3 / race Av1-4-5-6-7-8) TaxID=985895 RepID=E4ZRR5_LEPMJ|nr:predicted protein [Plenodomus lingam JN3]CBX93912.1 predicted protein [Plenodomus lingam JN3]